MGEIREWASRATWAGVVTVIIFEVITAQAGLLLSESFAYPDGPLVSVAGGTWQNYNGTSNQLQVANGRVLLTEQASEDAQVFLAGRPHTSGVLYVSFKLNVNRTPSGAGACFALLKDNAANSSRACFYVSSANSGAGSYRVGLRLTGVSEPMYAWYYDFDWSTNSDQRVVVRYEVNPPSARLWMNPATEADYFISVPNEGEVAMNIQAFSLRQSLSSGNGMGVLMVDDLRISTNFAEIIAQGVPPNLSVIADQAMPANRSTGAIPFTVGDADTPLDQLQVTATSDNPTLIPITNIMINGVGAQRTVAITPAAGQQGLARITLMAVDRDGLSVTRAFLVRVGEPGLSAIEDQVVAVNQSVGPLPFWVFDAENDPLQLTVTAANRTLFPNTNIVVESAGTNRWLTLTPTTGLGGHTTITLVLSDGFQKVTNRFEVTVAPHVGLLLAEDFDYPDGPLVGSDLNAWTNHSGSAGETLVSQGRLRLDMSLGEDVSARLTNQPVATGSGFILYTRFDLEVTTTPTNANPTYFAHFKDGGNNFRTRLFITTNGAPAGRYRLGLSSASATLTAVAAPNLGTGVVYRVVTRFNVNNGQCALWINPAQESDAATLAGDIAPSTTVVAWAFRQTANIGAMWIDGLRVGTAFADVVDSPVALSAWRSGEHLILQWPPTVGARLQSTTNLAVPDWHDLMLPPEFGGYLIISNCWQEPARFYRVLP